jgi:hypothetical protein
LEATTFEADGLRMDYVFFESRLSINVMYSIENDGKRAVGFKLSDGTDVPEEPRQSAWLRAFGAVPIGWRQSEILSSAEISTPRR